MEAATATSGETSARRMTKPPGAYRHGDLRNALIAAATELTVQRGGPDFTLREIAAITGVRHAAVYRHFASKAALLEEIARLGVQALRARIEAIPFIDTFDLRYNNRVKVPVPSTSAVMFCVMDVSGSMDEEKKQIAKRFFMLLYLFLKRTYEHIELVFIRHHTVAQEVDENDFFHSRESGGTVVSSALEMMRDIVRERYANGMWNIYGAQASDGDNWENDSPICRQILADEIMPFVQYFAYIEITPGEPQNLWREYEKLTGAKSNFAMQHIEGLPDIYPVFRELFKKKLV